LELRIFLTVAFSRRRTPDVPTGSEPAAADAFRRRLRDAFGRDVVVPDDGSAWSLE